MTKVSELLSTVITTGDSVGARNISPIENKNGKCCFDSCGASASPNQDSSQLRGFQQAKPLFILDADFGLINEDVRMFIKYFLGFQTHKKRNFHRFGISNFYLINSKLFDLC